jgi:hypothetical protein
MALFPIPVVVELFLNGAWNDITQFVLLRNDITITGGSDQKGKKPPPAQVTFTVDNTDGRFTPTYTGGAYYPYLTRNTALRISVAGATSSTGNIYSGYRFWGEVPQWPPLQDISGRDLYVDVTASGMLRRIRAGGGQGSALTRYYNSLTASFTPIAYWPCEEDESTALVGAGIDGGTPMTVTTGTPLWKAVSDFNGSGPIGVLNRSTWDGLTGSFGTSGDDVYSAPGTYTWVASTTTVNAKVWGGGGGGENGSPGATAGGGGGEFAQEATLAVTPGTAYTVVVGAGGAGGAATQNGADRAGGDGHDSTITGDAVTVRAHGGKGGAVGNPSAGGTGSTNTTHHNGGGGAGGTGPGGSGGGGSGGTAAAGNAGSANSGSTGGAGGAAVTGGGAGGHGGNSTGNVNITPGGAPGGGGGSGAQGPAGGPAARSGSAGAAGQVELVYTSTGGGTLPNNNVIRFILFVPKHGGNAGKVILNANTSGTIGSLRVFYQSGGNLQLKGFASANGGGATLFDSGNVAFGADGRTLMVSCELAKSGANVAWKLTAIQPGDDNTTNTASGTATTASVGNVTEVIVAPNADITKTAVGHISVQYALIAVNKVSKALHGHHTEMGVDRFIRLANEQALDNAAEFSERSDHWGFRDGIQGWGANNGAVTQSTVFTSSQDQDGSGVWSFTVSGTPTFTNYFILSTAQAASVSAGDRITISTDNANTYQVTSIGAPFAGFNNITFTPDAPAVVSNPAVVSSGAHSLLLTANGAGSPAAFGPSGTAGVPVNPGDIVSAACEVFAPVSLPNAFISVKFFNAAGTGLTETASSDIVLAANTETTMKVTATADATAAFFNVHVGDHHTDANNTLLYIDNVRVHPRMGPQTRKEYHKFLEEIEDLDQGIMREARDLHGLRYKTRFSLFNQTAAVTLDYTKGVLSPPLAPVTDDKHTANDITVHRHKGSKHRRTLTGSGSGGPPNMSVSDPPAGAGRYRKYLKVLAEIDAQLKLLADHLLALGTVSDERYPTITVDLRRAALAGNQVANIMSAVAGVEIGDMVQLTNLPFFYPQATAKCLVTGYTEVISATNWQITWNTVPYSPYVQVAGVPTIHLW